MERRTYLATVGSAVTGLTVGFAGCGGAPGGGAQDEGTDEAKTWTGTETDGDGGGGDDGTGGTDAGTDDETTTIDMVTRDTEYYFDPIGLLVERGTTVTWRNASGAHSSVAYDESLDSADVTRIPPNAEPWGSDVLSDEGAAFEHTLEQSGTYDYFCTPHKTQGMIGRIVVGEPGGPADDGQPPDGELPDTETILDQGAVSYDEFGG